MYTAKKEVGISKIKPKSASAGIKSFMAAPKSAGSPPAGNKEALTAEVAKGLKDFEQQQESKDQAQGAQIQAQQQQQNIVKKVEEKRVEHEIKSIKLGMPSRTKIMLALGIAIIWDFFVDLFLMVITAGQSEWFEWMGDVGMQFVMVWLLGPYYNKARLEPKFFKFLNKLPGPLWEFIPFLDIIPFHTLTVRKTIKMLKEKYGDLKELDKEKKMLEGGVQQAGFLGISQSKWAYLITIFGALAAVLAIISPPLAVFPFGIFGAIIFIQLFRNEETKGIAWTMAVLLLIVGSMLFVIFFFVADRAADWGGPLGEFGSSARTARQDISSWWTNNNPVTALKNYYKKQVLIATGDYYTGKVDQNAKAKLGVYLEGMKQADPVFYTDRPLIMYANLKVLTLDEPVNVSLYCKTTGLSGNPPQIFPRKDFSVDTYEEQEIDCMFEEGSVKKGAWAFELGADFNFKTMSYVKSYFMDAERLRSLRREEIDPLKQYGILDTEPGAVYTVGPVGIGMGVGKPPVGIDLALPDVTMTLGITIENLWDGSITKLSRFVLIIPAGFVLEEIGANKEKVMCSDLPPEEASLCDDSLNNVYVITDPTFVEVEKGKFKSYRGFMKVSRADYDKVLGISPVSTKYFKTTLSYTYRLKQTKTIDVKERQVQSLLDSGGMDVVGPEIKDVALEALGSGSYRISWSTSEESNDHFSWWDVIRAPPVYAPVATDSEIGFSTSHSRVVEGLSSIKTYGYKIAAVDISGNVKEKSGTFNAEKILS